MGRLLILTVLICTTVGCQPRRPNVILSAYKNDFGITEPDQKYAGSVVLTNCGNAELKIETINSGCGCTSVHYSKDTVAPKDTCALNFTYDTTNKIGEQTQYITIIANTDSIVHLFKISTNIEPWD